MFWSKWKRSATCMARGAPRLALLAYSAARSWLMISTPRCSFDHRWGVGGTIGQQVDRAMGLQIDQQGAVAAPLAQGVVVDRQDARGADGVRPRADAAQEDGTAVRQSQGGQEARTAFAPALQSYLSLDVGQAIGTAMCSARRSQKMRREQAGLAQKKRRTCRAMALASHTTPPCSRTRSSWACTWLRSWGVPSTRCLWTL